MSAYDVMKNLKISYGVAALPPTSWMRTKNFRDETDSRQARHLSGVS